MQTKTIGGDRLGAGKKMKVELHGYERSTHDLGYVWRSTMSAGTLVPFMCKVALPGDTFDINLDMDIKTLPTIAPLFGSFKAQLDTFLIPIRLYNAQLHNNTLGIGLQMSNIKFPVIGLTATEIDLTEDDIDNSQINPSSLPAYLGIRGVGYWDGTGTAPTRNFNAIPILAYWEIYKNYYANKQEEVGAVIHTPSVAVINTVTACSINGGVLTFPQWPSVGSRQLTEGTILRISYAGTQPLPEQILFYTNDGQSRLASVLGNSWYQVTPGVLEGNYNYDTFGEMHILAWDYISETTPRTGTPAISFFPLDDIDQMRRQLLGVWSTSPYLINSADLFPYKYLYQQPDGIPNLLSSQEGLGLKTYQSDLFNNWIRTESIEAIATATAVDTSSGSFTQDALNMSKKLYMLMNRISISGGSYDDWLDAVYDHDRYIKAESPMYYGGLIKELVFQEVVSNSSNIGEPLGTLAGKGIMARKHKGGHVVVKVDEPSIIMGIVSLTPRVDYSQGNDWIVNLNNIDELHKPALDQIGFQDLITEQMAWWDTAHNGTTWEQKSAGKQPAWINYMTSVNQTRGNFAMTNNQMFMTLNRRYEHDTTNPEIADLTTYIDPSKFNFVFAETALDAQNFWVQIAVDITARRKMSAKIMPNL